MLQVCPACRAQSARSLKLKILHVSVKVTSDYGGVAVRFFLVRETNYMSTEGQEFYF